MYDLVIVWTLTFSTGPYAVTTDGVGVGKSTQGAITIDRSVKTSNAKCQADLVRAKNLNGSVFSEPRLFVRGYCTPH